jgi:hypothetical protein
MQPYTKTAAATRRINASPLTLALPQAYNKSRAMVNNTFVC